MNDLGQFNNTHAAIAFALNFASKTYQRPLINRMAYPSSMGLNALGGLDGAAQAGMIRAELARLGHIKESMIIARMAPRKLPCSCRSACCAGTMTNPEWLQAIHLLINHCKDVLGLCPSYYKLREAILKKYFGEDIPLNKIAELCGVNRDTAGNHNSKLIKALKGLERESWFEIDHLLTQKGVIENYETT